mmetsp:Transcript_9947/g.32462  ORF Transcript_9947/g.32462 Transcript_9947/m.32462 type:complete len:248 (+) Transcript_9947:363-1106(+)
MSEPSSAAHAKMAYYKSRTNNVHKKAEYSCIEKALDDPKEMTKEMDNIKALKTWHKETREEQEEAEKTFTQEGQTLDALHRTARKRDSPDSSDSVAPESDDGPAAKAPRLVDDAAASPSPMGTFLAGYASNGASTTPAAPSVGDRPSGGDPTGNPVASALGALGVTMGGPDAPTAHEVFKGADGNATIEIAPVFRPAPGEKTCEAKLHLRRKTTANAGAISQPQSQAQMEAVAKVLLKAFKEGKIGN